jgi:hypothetical protein
VLSDNGNYLVQIDPRGGVVLSLNGQRLPLEIGDVRLYLPHGVNDRGDWLVQGIWKDDESCHTRRYVKNGELIDDGWSADYCWGSGGGYLSKSGKAVWTNGEAGRQYVVVDGVNYSNQWSDGYWDYSVDVLSDGTPVWYGRERGHSQIDLWIGGNPVSRQYDLGEYDWRNAMDSQYRWVDVNDRGEVAWVGAKAPNDYSNHVFKGDVDLTVSAMGSQGTGSFTGVFINEPGRVLWSGGIPAVIVGLWLDDYYLPLNSVLQPMDTPIPYGLNDRADVLWQRVHQIGGYIYHYVYINDFNLTADLYGATLASLTLAPSRSTMRGRCCGRWLPPVPVGPSTSPPPSRSQAAGG